MGKAGLSLHMANTLILWVFFCNYSNDFDHSQQMWVKETKYETMIFIIYYSEFIQSTIALLTRGPVNENLISEPIITTPCYK